MSINKIILNVVCVVPRHVFLVPLLLMFVGCASTSDLFSSDLKADSEPVTQSNSDVVNDDLKADSEAATESSSEDLTTDLVQDAQSGSKDISTKKDEVSEPETITSVLPLWENNVGDADYDEFSARDAVDDLVSLSFKIGTSVTGTTALVPVSYNDAVYAASASGQLTRFDSATGSEVWSINTYSMLSGSTSMPEYQIYQR